MPIAGIEFAFIALNLIEVYLNVHTVLLKILESLIFLPLEIYRMISKKKEKKVRK